MKCQNQIALSPIVSLVMIFNPKNPHVNCSILLRVLLIVHIIVPSFEKYPYMSFRRLAPLLDSGFHIVFRERPMCGSVFGVMGDRFHGNCAFPL